MLSNLNAKSLDLNTNTGSLRTVEPDEFLPPISWWTTLGGLVFLAIFSATIALVSVIKYKVTVKAPATVRPVGELRIVQAAAEGTIDRIQIKENQKVQEGDVIAHISDSRLQTQKSQLQGNIDRTQLQLTQIAAQLQATEGQIAAETDRINRAVASAVAELSRVRRNYQDSLVTTRAEVKEIEAAVELAREEMNRYQQLANTGAIPQLQIKEKEAALKTALARLETAEAALNPSQAEVQIAQEQIFQIQADGKATLAALNREREQLIQQRIEIQNQLSRDRQELQQIEIELEDTVVRASASGIIQELNLRNTQQIVRPGDVIATIASSDVPLEIRALVGAEDIDKVEIGGTVQMRVSACPYPDYGTLQGTVKAISPDVISSQSNNANTLSEGGGLNQAQASYRVTIKPKTLSLSAPAGKCSIQSGMEGRADIIHKEETLLTFILRKARLLADF
ncbi:HlyD family efflux transporter periplasmic adaptor subunit [Pleurocapsales cyanobacterium LEGE 06147]|nr:HlyD family efflux transporter periplasmic adaptor subunit [Pleurocapsales cyanobacterium LEGE 06147]